VVTTSTKSPALLRSQFVNGDSTLRAEPKQPSSSMDNDHAFHDDTSKLMMIFKVLHQMTPPTSDLRQLQTIKHLLTPLMLLKHLPFLDSRIWLIKNGLLLF
jgi:hypothetical protein